MLRQSIKFLLLALCFVAVSVPLGANAQTVNAGAPTEGCIPVVHRNWSGCIATGGAIIPFCTIDARTGAQTIRQLTQAGYDLLIRNGAIRACSANPTCQQATQFRDQTCPSGQSGNIRQQRTVCVGGDINNNTDWATISNTCQNACTQSTETSTTRTLCPAGQTGTITEQRTINVGNACGVNGNWSVISNTCQNTCTESTETSTTRTQCPAGQTGVITERRTVNVGNVCGVNGSWSVVSNTCTPNNRVCTTPWGQQVNHGQSVTAFRTQTVPNGQVCESETRTCNDGNLSGSFEYRECGVQPPQTCASPWGGAPIAVGASVTAFQANQSQPGQQCVSQTRTCQLVNGVATLSGTFTFQSCTPVCVQGTETRTNGQQCPVGQTGVITETRTTNVGGQCGVNGNWTITSNTCAPVTCALPWGGTINYNQTVTAWQAAAATQCVSQTRTCQANGQLSGSYTFQSCTQTCTPSTETRTSTPCPAGETGVITETRTINQNGQCGSNSAWTVTSNTCRPIQATCDIVLQAGNYINLNLYQLAQQQNCPIVPGVRVTLTILEGATVGSNSGSFASFTTGTGWPSNTTLRVINRGRILGKGGDGAYAFLDGNTPRVQQAQAGGPAIDAPYPMTFDNSDGEIWGGGGGGGTISFAHCSPAGGGGAGYVIGNTFIPYMECSVNGSNSREGRRLNGEIATRTMGAGNEYMIRQIGNDVNAAYYVSGPGGNPGQAGGNAALYVRTQHVTAIGSPTANQGIIVGYYYYTPTQLVGTGFDTGALIGGDAGLAVVNPQNVSFTGPDNGDRRGRDFPTNPPRRPTPQPPLTDLGCQQTTETRTNGQQCPAGQTGTITETRTLNVGNQCGVNGNWTVLSNTCTQTCTQGTETRTNGQQCPSGQSGTITETRTTNVNGQCGVNGAWTVTSNTCRPDQQELVMLLYKPGRTQGTVEHYPYCTDHYAAIGMEYNPNLPYKIDVVLITGAPDGRLGHNCGGTGNTGRLKFAEIPLIGVNAGQTFSLTANFFANIRGCNYAGALDANGNAARTVTINVDRSKYSTSYVNFVYTQDGVQLTGADAATAVLTQIPCIPYADFTGLANGGLFGVCPQNGAQTPGYLIWAERYVTIN